MSGNFFSRGTAWLSGRLQAQASVAVTYTRGTDVVPLSATFGRKLYKLDDGAGGVRVEWTDRDFIVPTASLVAGAVPFLPTRGDLVRVTEGGVVQVYEVLAPGGEAPFNWCDPYRVMLRIHTKFVGTE